MCGIFGFALKRPLSMVKVFAVLQKLEVHQYPQEPRPVGGYGAGVAYLKDKRCIVLEKVGAVTHSPAKRLSEIVRINNASVLIGHVRMPSPEFMKSATFKETAQPFLGTCRSDLTVVSAHNGKVANYEAIREKLDGSHFLESEKVELIDSEVIPHLFEDLLKRRENVKDAVNALFSCIEGSNTISLLQIEKERMFLHFVHKGKTRGLTVWTNRKNEVIFSSRKEPLIHEFRNIFEHGDFRETISIPCHKDESVKTSFTLKTN
jgi:glucosamine 6-phosphate synthetase-like amidotransferase/phosphosugar isomerase protein